MPTDEKAKSKVIQVSNISPTATREQVHSLFSHVGRIEDFKVYPSETNPMYAAMAQKMAYVKFDDAASVAVAQHLTNTVFIDRALICVPVPDGRIADEDTALKTGGPSWPGQRQLPPNVINQLQQVGDQQVVVTIEPTLAALGLPPYPSLPANTDAAKIEEIRRTIYVANLPKDVPPEEIVAFFNDNIGEVMYLRMAGGDVLPVAYCYIEFSNQHTVSTALQNNGVLFKGQRLRIQHSRVAIVKPQVKTLDMAKREVEEAMRVDRTAPQTVGSTTSRQLAVGLMHETGGRSRSPPWRNRRGSPSPERRRRSRSRSLERRRRERRRERERSRERRRRSKSKSRERSKKSSRRSRSHSRRDKDKDAKGKDKSKKERKKESDKDKGKEAKKAASSGEKKKSSSERKRERSESSRQEAAAAAKGGAKKVKTETREPLGAAEEDEMALRERLLERVLDKAQAEAKHAPPVAAVVKCEPSKTEPPPSDSTGEAAAPSTKKPRSRQSSAKSDDSSDSSDSDSSGG